MFSAPRVLLVGDAVGIDPLLGEGISFALGYGDAAARELRDAFTRNDFSFGRYRRRVLAHPTGRYMRRRANVAWLIYAVRSRLPLSFLGMSVGPLVGWAARHFLVDWGK